MPTPEQIVRFLKNSFSPKTHEEFLEDRHSGLGGTDTAVLLGASKYKSPFEMYVDKVEQRKSSDSIAAARGRILEPFTADLYSRYHRAEIFASENRVLDHPDMPWSRISPDYWSIRNGEFRYVEIKTTAGMGAIDWSLTVPRRVLIQIHKGIAIHNAILSRHFGEEIKVKCDLAVLYNDQYTEVLDIEEDEELSKLSLEADDRFWYDHLKPQIPPQPSSLADLRYLYDMHIAGAELDIDEEFLKLLAAKSAVYKCKGILAKANHVYKDMEEAINAEIFKRMQHRELATHDGESYLSLRKTKRGERTIRVSYRRLEQRYGSYLCQLLPLGEELDPLKVLFCPPEESVQAVLAGPLPDEEDLELDAL